MPKVAECPVVTINPDDPPRRRFAGVPARLMSAARALPARVEPRPEPRLLPLADLRPSSGAARMWIPAQYAA
jgi:hypothetical protein